MKITYHGHSAFRIETGKAVVLIDPFFTGNPAAKASWQEASKGCTHVLLTHGHGDHTGDSLAILKATGAVLVANFEICNYLNSKGAENYSPGNHGGRIAFDDFDVIFTNAWHWVGFPALIFLAGMQRIQRETLEAARIDGANDRVLLTRIIWPLVAPATTIIFTLTFIGSFNWFELPYVMSGLNGTPGGATDVLGLYFYRTAFGNVSSGLQDFGHGSALAVLMFLFIAAFSAVALRFLRRREIEV